MDYDMDVSVSLFIPAFNEAKIIESTISKVIDSLNSIGHPYEIWVADDGSTDDTVGIVNEYISNLPPEDKSKVILFEGKVNQGRGEVLHNAFQKANGRIICFLDADLATDLKHLPRLIEDVNGDFDIATGSRWRYDSTVKRGHRRKVISFFYNRFLQLLFGSKVQDHQCGFKSFKKDKLFILLKESGIIKRRGWAWDAELLIRAQKKGYSISEFPVEWKAGSKSGFHYVRDILEIGFYLLSLFIRLKTEKHGD